MADSLIIDLEKDIKKYNSKLVIITGDFFLNFDTQISREDKDWLYPQMIRAIIKIKDSIILIYLFIYKVARFNKLQIDLDEGKVITC